MSGASVPLIIFTPHFIDYEIFYVPHVNAYQ